MRYFPEQENLIYTGLSQFTVTSWLRVAYDQHSKWGLSGANYTRSLDDIPDQGHAFRAITATEKLQSGIESVPASHLPIAP
ncbi:MAG: hypothetical protein WCP07_04855 [bacterium]